MAGNNSIRKIKKAYVKAGLPEIARFLKKNLALNRRLTGTKAVKRG